MEARYETELVKNRLIPMSDGVTLAGDLYRPVVDHTVPALLSFYPYHKDDDMGPGYFEGALRALAQAGYACLLVDVRGTGNSAGHTVAEMEKRELRDYYEAVEWAAGQEWCDGKVGVWGLSYGSFAALATAEEGPPHLGAVAAFHGAKAASAEWRLTGGRLSLLQFVANWASWMVGQNYMPPGFRDPEGRWLSVWRDHLEFNVPFLVTSLDRLLSGDTEHEPTGARSQRIQTPVYLWAGWHDRFAKAMIEAFQMINAPKKLTVGPWVHVMPDVGHAGRLDYLHELLRWFDYWLKGEDTGIMQEPPVAIWVQQRETWVWAEDFPPTDVREDVFYLGPEGTLSEHKPSTQGIDTFEYDAAVGVHSDLYDPMGTVSGLPLDQRFDELKGTTYTTALLVEDMELCGAPQALIQHTSTVRQTALVVKLCDVFPDGRSALITTGSLDVEWAQSHDSTWGDVSQNGPSARLSLMPTAYLIRAGHRLRVFIAGSDFPWLLPSSGSGEIGIAWGREPLSLVRLPVRHSRAEVSKPEFLVPHEIPHIAVRSPIWRIEENPIEGTVTVRVGHSQSLAIDGGEAPATVSYTHLCSATASERGTALPSAHAESEACWESEGERIHLRAVMAFRPVGLDLTVDITLNGAPYWHKAWSRRWPAGG